nr:hypothetical protein [Tanacetum cinerariifolium]
MVERTQGEVKINRHHHRRINITEDEKRNRNCHKFEHTEKCRTKKGERGRQLIRTKETRLRQLMSSPRAPSARPSTPPNYSSGSSRNAECSNCKHLRGKISVLKATMNMHMHPEQHTVNLAALLHEVLNEMEKLDLE